MSRRSLKDLAQEPLTALSAMAGVALFALSLSASDAPDPMSGSMAAEAAEEETALDLRAGPPPRLEVFALPGLNGLRHTGADCAASESREEVGGRRIFVLQRGA